MLPGSDVWNARFTTTVQDERMKKLRPREPAKLTPAVIHFGLGTLSPPVPDKLAAEGEKTSFTSEAQTGRMQEEKMVEKGCENCRKWQEHCYWEHMDVSKIRFFKLMTGDFAKGISIPEKFTKNFNGHITKGLDLKAPSGKTWHVSVDSHADELLLLTSGWEDFAKAHELQENDLLLFTCSGSSTFEVLIFEASGCEKTSSLFANRTGHNMCKNLNNMVAQHAEHYSLGDSDDASMSSRLIGSAHKASNSKKSRGKTRPKEIMYIFFTGKESESPNSGNCHVKHETVEQDESDESNDIYANSNYYYSTFANRLTDEEKEEILSLAPIRLDNPTYMTVLQKRHRQRRNNALIIPSKFAADHLEARSQDIILRRPNTEEKWPVRYYHMNHTRCFQNLKLFKFMRENKIREGDVCLFELMKDAKKVTMTVHVIRKVDGQFVLVG
ncbi:hypothetical protein ACP70R_032421 [Stipagrostis hirtigluma subsp. patula]